MARPSFMEFLEGHPDGVAFVFFGVAAVPMMSKPPLAGFLHETGHMAMQLVWTA